MTFAQVVKAGGYCGWRVPGWEQKPTGLKDGLVGWSRTNNVLDDVWWALICTFPLMRGWENLQNSQMTSNMTFSPVFPFVLLLLHLVFGFGDGSGRTKENVWGKKKCLVSFGSILEVWLLPNFWVILSKRWGQKGQILVEEVLTTVSTALLWLVSPAPTPNDSISLLVNLLPLA